MYRIVGCILVVAAGAGMGFSGSMRLSEQIRILEKLLQMVICLKGEIRCGNASLPDAFYGAAGRMNGKYREFLISAGDIDRISICIPSAFGQPSRISVRIPRSF
mgnify:CR=1 FL=1